MNPMCIRGDHHCADLCPVLHGMPCKPPQGSRWRPHEGPSNNYRVMRAAIRATALDEKQQRYLRWLASWDGETAQIVASLIKLGGAP